MVELKHRQQKAASDRSSSRGTANFVPEALSRHRLAARARHASFLLDVSQHFFSLDPVLRVTHHCQHPKGRQWVKCSVILTKIEARHKGDSDGKVLEIKSNSGD